MVLGPLLGDNDERGFRFSRSVFIVFFGVLVKKEEEERLAGVDGEVSFERSISSGFDVLDAVIPSRRTTGVVGRELADKSMISSNRRRGRRVSSSWTNVLGVGCIVECSTKDAAAICNGRLCMVEAPSPVGLKKDLTSLGGDCARCHCGGKIRRESCTFL